TAKRIGKAKSTHRISSRRPRTWRAAVRLKRAASAEKGTRRESRTGHSRFADRPRKSFGEALSCEPAEPGPSSKGSSRPGSELGPGSDRCGPDGSDATGFMGLPGT